MIELTTEDAPKTHQVWAMGVEYMGQAYCGWQHQDHCTGVQTLVQGALSKIAHQPLEVICAGRTDTGVHALGQVIHFVTTASRTADAWVRGGNTQLPADIRLLWAQKVPDDFHARFSARRRSYRYVILNRPTQSAIFAGRVTWVHQQLDVHAMHQAAQVLLGEQDFSAFRAANCQSNSPFRHVYQVSVQRQGNWVLIDITANAFLYHMVRNIVGTLLVIGKGWQNTDYLASILATKDRCQAPDTAPADGLYLTQVHYDDWHFPQADVAQLLWG